MRASEYTWEHVRKAPEDARRREAIGGERVGKVNLDEVFSRTP